MSTLHKHESNDWCHICGLRRDELVDVWFPKDAEHDIYLTEYIRICSACAGAMEKVANGTMPNILETDHPKKAKHQSKYKTSDGQSP